MTTVRYGVDFLSKYYRKKGLHVTGPHEIGLYYAVTSFGQPLGFLELSCRKKVTADLENFPKVLKNMQLFKL